MISAAEMVDDNFDFEKTYLVHFVENKDCTYDCFISCGISLQTRDADPSVVRADMAELAWLAVMPEASSDDSAA